MINFLKKIFSGNNRNKGIGDEVDKLLNNNSFIDNVIQENFYEELNKLITHEIKNYSPDYLRFNNEFSSAIYNLKPHLDNLLISGLEEEKLNIFYEKHKETISQKYEFPGTNRLLSSYWYQIIRKLYSETQASSNIELKQRF